MKPSGTYKIRYRRPHAIRSDAGDPIEVLLSRVANGERRTERIVESLCAEIREGGDAVNLRVRRVFSSPREIFRVELDRPALGYQRTTLLGREALEALLESDDVRDIVARVA